MAERDPLLPPEPRESLGSFGTPVPDDEFVAALVEADFTWYGEQVRVHPLASVLDLMDFMAEVGHLPEGSPAGAPAMVKLLKAYVHPDDWRAFWQLARENHAGMSEFMALARSVVEYVTDRPTVRPAASTAGQQPTEGSSTGDFSQRDSAAIDILAGKRHRPDLAGFVVERAEYDREQASASG